MKKKTLLLTLSGLVLSVFLRAQDATEEGVMVDTLAPQDMEVDGSPSIFVGYESWKQSQSTAAFEHLSEEQFNQGIISDPALLLMGRVGGLQAYNRGGNPTTPSLVRVRGLSALSQRQPLYVIDGIPGAALESIDPNDIASITVLKDGSAQALYGVRASNGVILINTKAANTDQLSISYSGQAGVSQAYEGYPVFDAAAFRADDGVDLQSNTVWLDEITRDGFNQVHSLAVQGGHERSRYRISGNYRDIEGVLRKSGFQQLNLRGNYSTSLLQDKLKVQLIGGYTNRESEIGFQEAFRYAVSFNPTAPVFADNFYLPFNSSRFGGFFETLGLWDSFNPRSIVDLSDRTGLNQTLQAMAFLQYGLGDNLSLNFRYAYQDQFINERTFYSPQSYFRGNAASPAEVLRGRGDFYDLDQDMSVYELFVNYDKSFGNSSLSVTAGTSYTDGMGREQDYRLDGFTNTDLATIQRLDDHSNWDDESWTLATSTISWNNRLSAFFGRFQWNVGDRLFLSGSVRSEGSSRLGEDARWGAFPAVGAAYDFSKNSNTFDILKVRIGYGITGAVPDEAGVSSERIENTVLLDGTVVSDVRREANPNVKSEEKSELNFGIDFQTARLQGYFEWYSREVSDWIELGAATFPPRFDNTDALVSTGIELGVNAMVWNSETSSYQTGLRLSTYSTRYETLELGPRTISSSCCANSNPLIVGQEGERLGDFLAPEYVGANPDDGSAIFNDLDGDGQINLDGSFAYSSEGDLAIAGNGLPSMELGWTHQFRFGAWELNALVRGAFGHSLVNRQRQLFETRSRFNSNYNTIDSELADPNLSFGRFSDHFVEKANFLKLDYLSFARVFPLGNSERNQQLRVSLTAQNILLSSSYTGPDPEPQLVDYGSTDNGGSQGRNFSNPLAPGIDRRNHYLPANTFSLGVQLSL